MTRPRLRLQMCESQWRDQDRDWKIWVSMTRPRLKLKKSESQKWDWAKDVVAETPSRLLLISNSPLVGRGWYFVDVETETHRDWEIYRMSRPRLIKTEKFLGCRDRDSLRLGNFLDVKTEKFLGWPRFIETGKFDWCRYQDHSRLGKRCRYRDSRGSLLYLIKIDQTWFHLIKLD